MKIIYLFFSILTLISCKAFAENCEYKINTFLKNPNYKNYLMMHSNESAVKKNACWPELEKDVHKLAVLYKYAKQGNKWAIKILIKHLSDLGGGELEDAYRALGESVDRAPSILLVELKQKRMTVNQFKDALTMLPLSFVDNEPGRLSELKARKIKILSVKNITSVRLFFA